MINKKIVHELYDNGKFCVWPTILPVMTPQIWSPISNLSDSGRFHNQNKQLSPIKRNELLTSKSNKDNYLIPIIMTKNAVSVISRNKVIKTDQNLVRNYNSVKSVLYKSVKDRNGSDEVIDSNMSTNFNFKKSSIPRNYKSSVSGQLEFYSMTN